MKWKQAYWPYWAAGWNKACRSGCVFPVQLTKQIRKAFLHWQRELSTQTDTNFGSAILLQCYNNVSLVSLSLSPCIPHSCPYKVKKEEKKNKNRCSRTVLDLGNKQAQTPGISCAVLASEVYQTNYLNQSTTFVISTQNKQREKCI